MADILAYNALKYQSALRNENKDCGVIAAALACRVPYEVAHAALKAHGRPDRKGTYVDKNLIPAVQSLGLKVTQVTQYLKPNGSHYTPITVVDKLSRGYYICVTVDHLFAVVNGQVLDWVAGKKNRIIRIYQVTKPRKETGNG